LFGELYELYKTPKNMDKIQTMLILKHVGSLCFKKLRTDIIQVMGRLSSMGLQLTCIRQDGILENMLLALTEIQKIYYWKDSETE
jgi:hypothetical protein